MKLKDEVVIAPANEESILVDASGEFKGMIKLNSSASFVAKQFLNDITIEEAVKALTDEYNVDEKTATDAVNEFVSKMKEIGLIK